MANTLGSGLLYIAGHEGGRPLVRRYGRYFLIEERDVDSAAELMSRRPAAMLFLSRLLPVVRTYGGFAAGVLGVPVRTFVASTFLGSFLWCLAFIALRGALGSHWEVLRRPFEVGGGAIAIALLLGVAGATAAQVRRAGRPDSP